jgi:hypothetical protein
MVQIYADSIVSLLDGLRELEREAGSSGFGARMTSERQQELFQLLGVLGEDCRGLRLPSATKQLIRITERLSQGLPAKELCLMLAELHRRLTEDLRDKVFYCVTDSEVVQNYFKVADQACDPWQRLVPKPAKEVFDAIAVRQFPEATYDIEQACLCFIFGLFTACTFHLMRVIEFALLRLAKLTGMDDPKPSWGTMLNRVEKLALRTDFKDLPPKVQPRIEGVREILPMMQAIQRAWRNDKIAHVSQLMPVKGITENEARDVMNAVRGFMRVLAEKLPSD